MSAQAWLDEIGDHVARLHMEKAELEKALFTIASKVLKDHPEMVKGDDIAQTVVQILDDHTRLLARVRKLTSDPDGATLWAIIEEDEKDERDSSGGAGGSPGAADPAEGGAGQGGEAGDGSVPGDSEPPSGGE